MISLNLVVIAILLNYMSAACALKVLKLQSRSRPLSFSQLLANQPSQNNVSQEQKSKPLTIGSVIQLVLMGAGAPGLGEYKGTDPETGKMMFELEANNLVDSKGNDIQQRGKFFKDGWTENSENSIPQPPGFFQNLLSGGKLMEEWDRQNRISK